MTSIMNHLHISASFENVHLFRKVCLSSDHFFLFSLMMKSDTFIYIHELLLFLLLIHFGSDKGRKQQLSNISACVLFFDFLIESISQSYKYPSTFHKFSFLTSILRDSCVFLKLSSSLSFFFYSRVIAVMAIYDQLWWGCSFNQDDVRSLEVAVLILRCYERFFIFFLLTWVTPIRRVELT